tara:strand:+ start:67519 stop:70752 length:3234 start_codon:yes stop_codon:yes gene_type:complete
MKRFFMPLVIVLMAFYVNAQIDARMFRYPDISSTHISFVYAGDIWIVSKDGGTASRLSSPSGEEQFPKFSPDGQTIAFTANYDGNWNVYTIPITGGSPKRLTMHGDKDQVVDWSPDGSRILFASSRESGRQRFDQFFEISVNGGMAKKLALPYGSLGSYSPNGAQLAFNFKSRISRTWKRYKGGWAPDIWTYDLASNSSKNITDNPSSDEYPMWIDNKIYYISDDGPNARYNLWAYDLQTEQNTQLTNFDEWDIHFASCGADDIVFEAGGKLFVYNTQSGTAAEVDIKVITDQLALNTKRLELSVEWFDISPDGKRLIISSRGEMFSVPSEEGVTLNLTQSDRAAERTPSWSPDGKKIAYWSDATGEYQLTLYDFNAGKSETLTSYPSGFRYPVFWSPDSKKLAFIDQTMTMFYFDIPTRQTVKIDKGLYLFHGGLSQHTFSWSADSRWIAYVSQSINRNSSINIFDTQSKTKRQVTSDYYNEYSPTFDPDGKYLYFLTNRNFDPVYSDLDNTFIYPNSTMIAAATLTREAESPLKLKNDSVSIAEEDKKEESKKKKDKKKEEEQEEEEKDVKIDFDGFESRIVLLPVPASNYHTLEAVSGKVVFHEAPRAGVEGDHPVKYFDLEEREVKKILGNADGIELSADGKKLAAMEKGKLSVVDIEADQDMSKTTDLSGMVAYINPKNEWKQIFWDAWRLERDYFYDEEMHGLDWKAIGDKYVQLIDQCVTRWDVNFVLGEMIGELNASHTYRGGGDTEDTKNVNIGYLGVDWEISNGYYRIKKIIEGAKWDVDTRSPLSEPGVDVKVGDHVLAVNGIPLSIAQEPYAAFQGLADKTVELTVNSTPSSTGSRKVLVKTLKSESRLRHLNWIESNRLIVDKATEGRAGYIYVRSTGLDGQNELIRQFMAQFHKDALIIDERFNSGGQIPDRFIELINRKPLAFWDVRDGATWQWPPVANFGPKVMLINGWSGSGGDAFPDYFKKAELGPLVGTRTWGGLIGISGVPALVDGGMVTVPTFRMYNPDGDWFREGYGVPPDIPVDENPGELAKGNDDQLLKAIEWIKAELENYQGLPDPPQKERR